MKVQRCTNDTCRRPFQINEFAGRKPHGDLPEAIVCPHCGHQETRWSDSVFLVHALSAEQEAAFDDDKDASQVG
ncbi:hypothetical protein E4K72_03325 [Oxalobacteraceae bacterium OM1]|nr:hypothetical protein E4K72_03325 [Oxalobacteraceae bacterium OM1]